MLARLAILLTAASANAGIHYTIPIAVFSYDYHPAEPRDNYVQGDLGIIRPSYARSYLYTAYRWMDGSALTGEEGSAIREVWSPPLKSPSNAPQVWRDLRETIPVLSLAPKGRDPRAAYLQGRNYTQYLVCTPHSFERASQRLQEHVDRFGVESDEVREWVQAQDVVIENCYGGKLQVPADAPANIDPVIREDRRYQQAAAQFISGDLYEAEAAFRRIEPNRHSWAGLWAPYMVGRSILWQARIEEEAGERYFRLLRKARYALEAVVRDDDLHATHDAARYLLIRILALTDQESAARLLGLRLTSPLRAESRAQDLRQYLNLLRHHTAEKAQYRTIMQPHEQLRRLGRRDRLTDWILAFQSRDPKAYLHSLERWRETRSTAWLVACLAKAQAGALGMAELLEAAAAEPSGPGWASVQYYRARLLASAGERDQARAVLDRLLPKIADRSSSWNRALALRAEVSETPSEMLRFGVQSPASYGTESSGTQWTSPWRWGRWAEEHYGEGLRRGKLLMPEVSDILDSAVPLDRFAEIAVASDNLPKAIRRDLTIAAWVRAVLLNNQEVAFEFAARVAKIAPETEIDMAEFQASDPRDRPTVARNIILKFPGMSARVYPGIGRQAELGEIHLSGFNWWWWTNHQEVEPSPPQPGAVDWLTATELAAAKEEWKRIVPLGSGPEWLYRTILQECDQNGAPADCPEALYRVAVSEGSIDFWHALQFLIGRRDFGYRATQILSQRYSHTSWARHVETDYAASSRAWDDGSGGYRQSVRYPR